MSKKTRSITFSYFQKLSLQMSDKKTCGCRSLEKENTMEVFALIIDKHNERIYHGRQKLRMALGLLIYGR